jgi:hypothetical protein
LAEIFVVDVDAQYQSLQFSLFNTTSHSGTALSMIKTATKNIFQTNSVGDLGTITYP